MHLHVSITVLQLFIYFFIGSTDKSGKKKKLSIYNLCPHSYTLLVRDFTVAQVVHILFHTLSVLSQVHLHIIFVPSSYTV